MKTTLLFVCAALICAGCSSSSTSSSPGSKAARPPAAAAPTVTPIARTGGKVASVNQELRFIVVDFSLSGVPREGSRFAVYRAGQKVAEVKITGPVVGTNTAADILNGNVQPGDAVQEE